MGEHPRRIREELNEERAQHPNLPGRAGGTVAGDRVSGWGSATERGSPALISSRSRETIGDLMRAALRYS